MLEALWPKFPSASSVPVLHVAQALIFAIAGSARLEARELPLLALV